MQLHAEQLRHTTVASKTSDVTTMNFGTSLLIIFVLTSVGLVVYWFYHKYKLEREQIRFMQWARSVMRERYDSDTDSSHSGLHTPRYHQFDLVKCLKRFEYRFKFSGWPFYHRFLRRPGGWRYHSIRVEWPWADSLKRSFAQKQGRVGGYDGNRVCPEARVCI